MTATKPAAPKIQNSLQVIIQEWKDQIICFSPQGSGYNAYFVDARNGSMVNYIHASCDELRHLGSNYNSILNKIKEQYYGYLKEAILNTVKYEATRRVVRKQHDWIQSSYQGLIEQQEFNFEQQALEIERLKQIIVQQQQEVASIKNHAGRVNTSQEGVALLQEKEAEIAAKNYEIAQLKQQLQDCDREISSLKTELSNGLQELKLKYKGLISQFITSRSEKQLVDGQNKSLQACKNIFIKAQKKINSLQGEHQLLSPENQDLQSKVKLLRV